MAATSSTASTATWGVTTATGEIGSVNGVVTDLIITTKKIETPDVQDEEGTAVLRKFIEEHITLDATITCKADATLPNVGDDLTIDSVKYFITNINKTESNQAWTSVRISAEKYSECDSVTKTTSMTTA